MSQTNTYGVNSDFTRIPLLRASASTYEAKCIEVDTNSIVAEEEMIYRMQSIAAEIQWSRTLNSPEGKDLLRRMAKEALRQLEAGETEEGGFSIE